jgi:hypothetical protein
MISSFEFNCCNQASIAPTLSSTQLEDPEILAIVEVSEVM